MQNLREDKVQGAVKFLTHANVKSSPLSERVKFLESKGLTFDEIDEALKRAEGGQQSAASPQTALTEAFSDSGGEGQAARGTGSVSVRSAPQGTVVNAMPKKSLGSPLERFLRTSTTLAGLGALGYLLYKYIFDQPNQVISGARTERAALTAGPIPDASGGYGVSSGAYDAAAAEVAEQSRNASVISQEISALIQAIDAQSRQIQQMFDYVKEREAKSQVYARSVADEVERQRTEQTIAELKAEVNTLKLLVLSQNSSSTERLQTKTDGLAAGAGETAVQSGEEEAEKPEESVGNESPQPSPSERLRESLENLLRTNDEKAVLDAIPTLQMYIKNLLEHPDNPRYRRIPTVNANFKNRVATLQGYEDLFTSLGFTRSANYFEWSEVASRGESSDTKLLSSASKCLAAYKESKSIEDSLLALSDVESNEDIVSSASSTASTEKEGTGTSPERREPLATAASTTPTEISGFNDFLNRLKPQELQKPGSQQGSDRDSKAEVEEKVEKESSDNGNAAPAEDTAAQDDEADKDAEKGETASVDTLGEPEYPSSFMEVMKMVKEGKEVPGIKQIPNQLSVDARRPSASKLTPPVKPWEKLIDNFEEGSRTASQPEDESATLPAISS